MFASVVTMLWAGTQLDPSIQFSAIPYFPWFKGHAGSLRVFGVVLLPQQPSFPWPWASCLSMFYRVSHFSPGFLQQCNEMYVRKIHNSKLWMWVWMVGYMSVWTFWWTGQSLLETVILPLNFLYLAHQKLSLNLFTDKASTPSLRSSLFHIYGCSLPWIYSANHCWLTQKTLFLKYIFPICLHGVRDGRGHQLILLVKPGSDDMNEVWSATHRTRNGMLKILKNLIIWMSFRYQNSEKGLNSAHLSLEANKLLIMLNLSLGTHTPIHSHYADTHTHTHSSCKRKIALNTETPIFR